MSKILVDTSVWINYFQNSKKHNALSYLIKNDLICTNQIILSELMPSLIHQKQNELLKLIKNIQIISIEINWNSIINYQVLNLANGINKVGIVDVIIAQNIIDNKLTFYTQDKHFHLMSNILKFELYEED